MAKPGIYNPPTEYEGNTSDPMVFNFEFDLTDYAIEFTMALEGVEVIDLSVNDGITVSGTQATVGPFTVPAADGKGATTYNYQLTLTSPAGVKTTYVRGNIRVQGDVTW